MLEKNLQALSVKNPELVKILLNYQSTNLELLPLECGDYNLIYNDIPIHDIKDPQLESSIIFGEEDNNENNLCLVFGLGLGYLFKRANISSKGYIVLYEPSLDILKFTLTHVDFAEELSDSRVFVFTKLSELINPFYKYSYDGIKILYLNSYKQMYPDLLDQVYLELNKYFVDQKTNLTKSVEISKNFMSNIPDMIHSLPVDKLKDSFKGKTALVVSAGPSLDKAIHTIKDNQDKFVIICIGQALKALYENDIKPHFVVMIDMLPLLHQVSVVESPEKELNLILYPSVSPDIAKLKANSKFFYIPESDFMCQWIADILGSETYKSTPTVSICAFYIAKLLGVDSIVLVGQDLAYTDGQLYAKGSVYDSIKLDIGESGVKTLFDDSNATASERDQKEIDSILRNNVKWFENVIKVKGQNEGFIYTSNSYATFISMYKDITEELIFSGSNINLYNASVGGAYLEGFEHMSIDDIVKLLPETLNSDPEEIIKGIYNNTDKDQFIEASIKKFAKLASDLTALKEDSIRLSKLLTRIQKELFVLRSLNESHIPAVKVINDLYVSIKKRSEEKNISFIYPFIQKELFYYNKISDRKLKDPLLKIKNDLKSIKAYSEAMILGSNRVLQQYNRIKSKLKRSSI